MEIKKCPNHQNYLTARTFEYVIEEGKVEHLANFFYCEKCDAYMNNEGEMTQDKKSLLEEKLKNDNMKIPEIKEIRDFYKKMEEKKGGKLKPTSVLKYE